MNHASSNSGSHDIIGFLRNQHAEIKGMLEQVLATQGPDRKKTFTTLKTFMAAHEAAEETVVHPAAKRTIAGGPAEVAARLAEEKEAKKALSMLEKLDVGSSEFESKFRTLQKAVLAHAKAEEAEEFEKLAEKLDVSALEEMRSEAEKVEGESASRKTR